MLSRALLLIAFFPLPLFGAIPQDVTIQVVDSQGAAVANATLEFRTVGTSSPFSSGVANRHGVWIGKLDLPVEVRASAPGFEPLRALVDAEVTGVVRLSMRPATLHTTIDVIVHDSAAPRATLEQTALEIERTGSRTVFDAVEKLVPSTYVSRRGIIGFGLGQSGTFTMRGLGGTPTTQLLVVVDGRPDFMGLMGHPLADCYTLTDVGSLSVTEGPASVLYGSNAMAGAVEVKPTRPLPGMHTSLVGSLGSYYTGQYRLTNGAQWGRWFYNLTGGVAHTNGHRPESAYRNQDGTLALGYDVASSWKTSVHGRFGHFYVEDPGKLQTPVTGNWARVGRGGFSWDLDNNGSRTWGMARVFSSFGHHMLYDGFRSVDNAVGTRIQQSFLAGSHATFDVGTDIIHYGGRARDISSGLNYGEFHVNDAAGFTRARYAASSDLQLNAGLRYDYNSQAGDILVPEFGAAYRFREAVAISGAVTRGFRNPTIRELYLFPAPTPDLKPERMWNYQATLQLWLARSFLAWITGYYSDADNLILPTGFYPNLRLENSGKTINKGFDVHGRWQPARRASLNTAYARLHSTNLAPYSPENRLIYSLDLDASRLFFSLGGTTVGRTFSGAGRTAAVGGYTVANFKCTMPFGEHTSLFVIVDNILNRRYEVISGYVMPGANAAAGFDLKF